MALVWLQGLAFRGFACRELLGLQSLGIDCGRSFLGCRVQGSLRMFNASAPRAKTLFYADIQPKLQGAGSDFVRVSNESLSREAPSSMHRAGHRNCSNRSKGRVFICQAPTADSLALTRVMPVLCFEAPNPEHLKLGTCTPNPGNEFTQRGC